MAFRTRSLFVLLACLALAGAAVKLLASDSTAGARLLHSEPSQFGSVLVFEEYGQRCMNFNSIEDSGRQTCMRLDDPDEMVFAYTRMMTSALFAKPDPRNVLIIGLGGATLPLALAKILPDATIDTVDIDPAVVRVAKQFFGYQPGPRQRVFVEDGRAYVERVHNQGRRYDMVMLDAFDDDYIPAHLMTREFLAHVKAILAGDGVLVANSFAAGPMHNQESATYAAVFGEFFELRNSLAGNRVIIASPGPLPDAQTLEQNAEALERTLAPFGIDTEQAVQRFDRQPTWDHTAQVLTDEGQAIK